MALRKKSYLSPLSISEAHDLSSRSEAVSIQMETYTLFDLQEHLRRVVALNFATPVWISCEVTQCKPSKGQHYLSLVQKAEGQDTIIAQADAILWARTHRRLQKTLGGSVSEVLQAGRQVRMQVRLDYHERYGLKLFIEDLDIAYTIGQLELKRRAIIEALQKKELIHKNATLALPSVLQHIAVLSSEQAAGLQDFLAQIKQNPYQYRFKIHLFPTAMQGEKVRPELLKQLKKINSRVEQFDAAIIIRGGGARLDLSAFDDLEICKAVAKSKLPVLTGIGHDIDESILDLVAHTSLKTPTAVADFIIQHNARFESHISELEWQLQHQTGRIVQGELRMWTRLEAQLKLLAKRVFHSKQQALLLQAQQVPLLVRQKLQAAQFNLERQAQLQYFLSVEQTLARGFSLVTKNADVVASTHQIKQNDNIRIHFKDGNRSARIEE